MERQGVLGRIVAAVAALSWVATAQAASPVIDSVGAEVKAVRDAAKASVPAAKAGVPADVGDPDSFGREVIYLGLAQSGTVLLQADCTPDPTAPLGPDDRCVPLDAAPATTTFAFEDLGRITLPGKSTRSLLCFWTTHFVSRAYANTTANPGTARLTYRPSITIEAAALSDPRAVDPNTGLAYGGRIDLGSIGSRSETRTLAPGDFESDNEQYSRTCIGGYSRRAFTDSFGLPADLVDRLYAEPMTLRLNISGAARMVDSAFLFFGVRFVGD